MDGIGNIQKGNPWEIKNNDKVDYNVYQDNEKNKN